MAYMCIYNHKLECDGCMKCKETTTYHCPVCGAEIEDAVYVYRNGDIVGCERCIKEKEPSEVLGRFE